MATALPVTAKILDKSQKSVEFRDFSASLGDGYEQVAPAGLNFKRDVWDVVWGSLTNLEVTTIEGVLDAAGSWGILTWTPCHETVQKKFRMDKSGYTRSNLGNSGKFTITCKLRQVYDIT